MKYLTLAFLLFKINFALAEQGDPNVSTDYNCTYDCVATDSWAIGLGLGYGKFFNPLHDGKEKNLSILPSFYYYADNFYIENTELGYVFYESQAFTLKIKGKFNNDGLYFNDSLLDSFLISSLAGPGNFGEPPEYVSANEVERDYSYMGGLGVDYYLNDTISFSSGIYHDVTNVHNGHQINLAAYYTKQTDKWRFQASFGFEYASQDLNDYYYGLRLEDNTAYAEFELSRNVNASSSISFDYKIFENLSITARYQYTKLGNNMTVSPLVEKHQAGLFFIGVSSQIGSH